MTYQNIDGETSQQLTNLSGYPLGSKIRCVVTATPLSGADNPTPITRTTSPEVVIVESPPENPSILDLTLTDAVAGQDVEATATISYPGGDLAQMEADGWTVTWEWQIEEEGTGPGDGTLDPAIWKIEEDADSDGNEDEFTDQFGTNTFTDYARVTRDHYSGSDYKPGMVCKPETAEQVMNIMNYCDAEGLDFVVRTGTHSYIGEGTDLDHVVIDMKLMCEVNLDPVTETVEVGGGAVLWQLAAELRYQRLPDQGTNPYGYGDIDTGTYTDTPLVAGDPKYGYWTPSGSGHQVGFSSVASAGGISNMPNRYGLMCDLIVEADVIIPDQTNGGYKKVTARTDNEYSDLLNGLRGLGNSSLGIVTRWKTKVFQRKRTHSVKLGLAWNQSDSLPHGGWTPDDDNIWYIFKPASGWADAENTVEWKFGMAVYEAYQDLLMSNETWETTTTHDSVVVDIPTQLQGQLIWPHGDVNGIDGTFFMWGNPKGGSMEENHTISYHSWFDCFDHEYGLVQDGMPIHLYYLTHEILERAIAKQTTNEFERFRSGTKGGTAIEAIHSYESWTNESEDSMSWPNTSNWNPSGHSNTTQISGTQGKTKGLNTAMTIPNSSPNDAAVADATFRFYRDMISEISENMSNNGIFHRYFTHSTCPNGPVAEPQHNNVTGDVLGWRDRPNEIQMWESGHNSLWIEDGNGNYSLDDGNGASSLGNKFYSRRIDYMRELISLYGGEDPRSYTGYLDGLQNYLRTPSGQDVDIRQYYYGTVGKATLQGLKAKYDPDGKFPNGPQLKPREVLWEEDRLKELNVTLNEEGRGEATVEIVEGTDTVEIEIEFIIEEESAG